MNRLRSFLADLALIPAMWRVLGEQTRRQIAREAKDAVWKATPGYAALVEKYGEGFSFAGFGLFRALADLGFAPDGRPL